MDKLREAARQALEAFHAAMCDDDGWRMDANRAITALREALGENNGKRNLDGDSERIANCNSNNFCASGLALAEQAEQEPVAWRDSNGWFTSDKQLVNTKYDEWTPVYAAPPRTKDLSDDEIEAVIAGLANNWSRIPLMEYARAVIAALMEYARAVIAADREKNK